MVESTERIEASRLRHSRRAGQLTFILRRIKIKSEAARMNDTKRPRLVGHYIRSRREAIGLSQRALGMIFSPAVTTQFISNVERGVTPLPPAHVPTLAKALNISESDIMNLLEKEYSQKLNERLGRPEQPATSNSVSVDAPGTPGLTIAPADREFMQSVYNAYKQADVKTRETFATVCESILNVPTKTG
jgi:transcriptional regulator with XRE-family HTH domain